MLKVAERLLSTQRNGEAGSFLGLVAKLEYLALISETNYLEFPYDPLFKLRKTVPVGCSKFAKMSLR